MGRILYVEDDEDMQVSISYVLEKEDHTIDTCSSGEKALELVESKDYDLFLVDLLLPGMDGSEFCRMLRADERTADAPIIMFSSMASKMGIDVSQKDIHWAPIDRFIEKGSPIKELLEAIQELTS